MPFQMYVWMEKVVKFQNVNSLPECYSAVIQIFSGTWIRSKRKKTFPGENEICTFGIFMNESHSKKHTFTTLDVFLSCLNCLQPFYSLGVNDRKWNQFHDPALLNQIPPHRKSKKKYEGGLAGV